MGRRKKYNGLNDRYPRLYNIWREIKNRCSQTNNSKSARYYSHRGISICNEWRDSFEMFVRWSLNNEYNNDLTIDRIDNNANYCPENCRWVDKITQSRNRRNNTLFTCFGETKCLSEFIYSITT